MVARCDAARPGATPGAAPGASAERRASARRRGEKLKRGGSPRGNHVARKGGLRPRLAQRCAAGFAKGQSVHRLGETGSIRPAFAWPALGAPVARSNLVGAQPPPALVLGEVGSIQSHFAAFAPRAGVPQRSQGVCASRVTRKRRPRAAPCAGFTFPGVDPPDPNSPRIRQSLPLAARLRLRSHDPGSPGIARVMPTIPFRKRRYKMSLHAPPDSLS